MTLSSRLRYEKTQRANKSSTTFNAPGNYPVPYGRGLVKVGGRGASGNPNTGGNIANYNPSQPGNVANYNPTVPGNVSGYNTAYGGNVANYNPIVPGNPTTVPGNLVPASYTPGNTNAGSYQEILTYYGPGGMADCPSGWSFNGYDTDEFGKPHKMCSTYTPGNTNTGTYTPAYYNNPSPGTNAATGGNANYNPYVPSTANYNPSTGGNANYNPSTPGNANYNPTVPGNAGTPTNVGGVAFPGGAVGSLAPVVPPTPSNLKYSTSGYAITVPPGAYVTVTPF